MRIGIVVDAGCDLPEEFIAEEKIVIMPIAVRIGDHVTVDARNDAVTEQFLDSQLAKDAAEAETIPYTAEQISELFLSKLVVDYDYVMCETIAGSRSPIFENAVQASFKILNDYRAVREAAGHNSPFNMRVLDTGCLFAAQGLIAWETARLRRIGTNPQSIRNKVSHFMGSTHGMLVTPDLYYVRNRARHKGDRSVSLVSAALGSALDIKPILYGNKGVTLPVAKVRGYEAACKKLLDHVSDACREGLLTPCVTLSFGGDLNDMRNLPGYGELRHTCEQNGITLMESMMSLTGIVNTGPGTLAVGYAKEGGTPKF